MKNLIFSFSVFALIFLAGCGNNNISDTDDNGTVGGEILPYTYKDWMGKIEDGTSIADMTIPGTHDSGAYDCDFGELPSEWILAQSLTIGQQLLLGVRWLDLRVYADESDTGYDLRIYHEEFDLNLDLSTVLFTVKEYLKAYPTEAVMLTIKQENSSLSNTDFSREIYKMLEMYGLDTFYLEGNSLPTMGDVRGKIVIFRRFSLGDLGHQMGYQLYWDDKTPGEVHHHNDYSFFVQDYYYVDPSTYWLKRDLVSKAMLYANVGGHDGTLYLNYASAYAKYHYNRTVASNINPTIDNISKSYYHQGKAGVIFVNFAGSANTDSYNLVPHFVKHIIEINYGL